MRRAAAAVAVLSAALALYACDNLYKQRADKTWRPAKEPLDQAIWPQGYSDLKLLGYTFTRQAPGYLLIAVPWHLANSVAFAWVYAHVAGPRLPGPGWLRGLLFGLMENNGLWFTVLPLAAHAHPGMRRGWMPRIHRGGVDLLVGNLRHVALGLVLGAICPVAGRRD